MPSFTQSPLNYPQNANTPINRYRRDRDPTTADFLNFVPGDEWVNFVNNSWWKFVRNQQSVGIWILIGNTSLPIEFLEGNSGGPVGPDPVTFIVNTVGDVSTIDVVGNPATHTLTWSVGATVATTYTEDSGSAVPALNNLNIFGSAGINTSGAGSTVTIAAGPTIATTYHTDSGNAIPAANILNVLGGTGCNTSATGNTITINATGGGFEWVEVTTTTQAMAINVGYVANNAGLVTLTLPATAPFGASIAVQGKGTGLFRIAQNAGQTIHFGARDTTPGAGGSATATRQYDNIELLCITANTDWVVRPGTEGDFTIV